MEKAMIVAAVAAFAGIARAMTMGFDEDAPNTPPANGTGGVTGCATQDAL